ncbi:four helix bundle protein [Dasania sp. GY-MA-18]|uniref:Four helix bundle protein n=1 Tax=Dasania phycosphaerae TaxID=2950436 RepID=A0A9J6RPY7_9GAMM|nr:MULTISPECIES: four helix bundle protein [Dasania]MCR8923749.1 four helix bundle protein [Dasania sp. GY-MA-18]MCZ0866183.1 four helix bundle protein [Dasania phycosphaerae]MCZ0869907.1 four helix bundle protein [Dasania phycosphaerae]
MKHERLLVWQRSVGLSVEIYRYFASCKDYGFKDQITRSGLSIPSNIAEGVERRSDKETIHFLGIAKGSAAELSTQVLIGKNIGLIDADNSDRWRVEIIEIAAMLGGLMNKLAMASD